ncbi:Sulfide-quinone reductase [Sulfuracidifex tepidarius]|uniref:Sulfide-quinone reductase n=1 Tax=Sulfuracidifex tepidarius TaxID=1294262 RepID=A0A510DYW6_9CREN|nr:FAD/NAD(P)-binding oxidoreductase [Sulfuracidifex tepidarius]BBG25442.1 Sulfide-quinone reductase [Sulfuracidifex tepidarius]
MKKVVIAGGGIAGTIVANRIAQKLSQELDKGEVEIEVLTESDEHVYLPGQLLLSFGVEDSSSLVKKEKYLLDPRIKLSTGLSGKMKKIDVGNHEVVTEDGRKHRYDDLVIATGVEYAWNEIKGYREGSFTPFEMESAIKLREKLADFSGGTVVVNVSKLPHRCPVAPLEVTMLLEDMAKKRGIREKTRVIYTFPVGNPSGRVFGIDSTNKVISKIFEDRGIEVISPFNVTSVDPEKKVIESSEGEKINYDLLISVPPNIGSKIIEDSEIGDRRRWVPTDKFTLNMKGHSDVYVIGDTTDLPISKAGSTADFESYIIANNVANDVRGNIEKKSFDGSVLCYIATGLDSATYIRFNYNRPPVPPPPSYIHWWGKLMYNKMYWNVTAKAIV